MIILWRCCYSATPYRVWRINLAKNRNQKKINNNRVFCNHNIRSQQVRCINHNDEMVGIIPKLKAISMAENEGLDLVQITAYREGDVPTCKIVNYGKYKYEFSKRQKAQAKKQRESVIKTKEIKFKPGTDINDMRTKANMAKKFLKDGCRVKVGIYFKGREFQHKDLAPAKLDLFLDLIGLDLHIFNEPKFEGRIMSIMIAAATIDKSRRIEKAS